jgi:hypothetical protein
MRHTIKVLTETVRGRVIIASDPDYDDARAVYNAMHDRNPTPSSGARIRDVMAAVAAGRDGSFDLAIRGGGPVQFFGVTHFS